MDNTEDQFLLDCFDKCKRNVVILWRQFEMTAAEIVEIMKMSRTDCITFTAANMSEQFPAIDKFLFLKFDGLCLANHYQESVFVRKHYDIDCIY